MPQRDIDKENSQASPRARRMIQLLHVRAPEQMESRVLSRYVEWWGQGEKRNWHRYRKGLDAPLWQEIWARVRDLREALAWNYQDMAGLLNISAIVYSRREKLGDRALSLTELVMLALTLGVTVDFLLTGCWQLSGLGDPKQRYQAQSTVALARERRRMLVKRRATAERIRERRLREEQDPRTKLRRTPDGSRIEGRGPRPTATASGDPTERKPEAPPPEPTP